MYLHCISLKMERKERKSPASDTLYEVLSLESETEREKRKTTASPGVLPGGPGTTVPSPPEDDEEEGDYQLSFQLRSTSLHGEGRQTAPYENALDFSNPAMLCSNS